MICDECNHNAAAFHSIKIINGLKFERHLCAKCQSESSQRENLPQGLSGLFSNFSSLAGATPNPPSRRTIKTCPKCSITMPEVLKTGFLGCPHCYDTFTDVLMPMIQKVQNSTFHKGKTPNTRGAHKHTPAMEIARLKAELARAVGLENYEEAAAIKATLTELTEGERNG